MLGLAISISAQAHERQKDLVNDTIESVVDAGVEIASTTIGMGVGLVKGKLPSKDQVDALLDGGITLVEIASFTGLAIAAIKSVRDKDDDEEVN